MKKYNEYIKAMEEMFEAMAHEMCEELAKQHENRE